MNLIFSTSSSLQITVKCVQLLSGSSYLFLVFVKESPNWFHESLESGKDQLPNLIGRHLHSRIPVQVSGELDVRCDNTQFIVKQFHRILTGLPDSSPFPEEVRHLIWDKEHLG